MGGSGNTSGQGVFDMMCSAHGLAAALMAAVANCARQGLSASHHWGEKALEDPLLLGKLWVVMASGERQVLVFHDVATGNVPCYSM